MTESTAAGFGHLIIRAGPAARQPAGHLAVIARVLENERRALGRAR
jgi:hypothetical protein